MTDSVSLELPNPEHYAGRNALSPAYRDRFHETHVRNPNLNAKAMEEMMTWLVFGRTPKITVNGVEYESSGSGTRTGLADIPSMSKFFEVRCHLSCLFVCRLYF